MNYLNFMSLITGIAAFRAEKKNSTGNRKLNTRGMMNIKGVDVENDDDFSGPRAFQLRPSVGNSVREERKKKKGCKC